ncbi:MAG: hypothetical protein JWP82_835 [Humibacillus sp.]|nr:hypothetical protein [Humibacillus sp.]
MAADDSIRIGTRERGDALAALAAHRQAGRLDDFELEDRRGRVLDAVTRGEVRAVFADLPVPGPAFEGDPARRDLPRHLPSATQAADPADPADTAAPGRSPEGAPGRRLSTTLVVLAPFIGLAACVVARSWVGLLLVPVIVLAARQLDR